jgi:transposase
MTQPPGYPEELRQEAQRQHDAGRTLRAIARDLGVSHEAVRQWVGPADGEEPLDPDEREEIRSLRRRLRRAEEERDILKKAVAFFAKESGDR